MIEAIRITLTAYTASFRVPHFVGHQLTLPVPPLSTIYGILSAAKGQWVKPEEVEWLAYQCEYAAKATDLEAIWAVERSKPQEAPRVKTRNVVRREFLTFPRLTLYLPPQWGEFFRSPRYALLLGRSQDVAGVESMEPVTLHQVDEGQVSGVLLPLEVIMNMKKDVSKKNVSAWLHHLPIAFTEEPRRRWRVSEIFGVVDSKNPPSTVEAKEWLVQDETNQIVVPIYRHDWVEKVLQRAVSQVG